MTLSPFRREYLIALAAEVVLTILEYLTQLLSQLIPWPWGALLVWGVISLFTLGDVYFRGVESHHRPPLGEFLVFWVVGLGVTAGVQTGLNFLAPNAKGEIVVRRVVVFPTMVPTYTPLPTYTPFLTPTPSLTPTLAPHWHQVCADAPPSPFEVGTEGYICTPDKVLLRTRASLRAGVEGSIASGTRFVIVGGPECGDRRVWWYVRLYYNGGYYGMKGWVPESAPEGTEVYLCSQP